MQKQTYLLGLHNLAEGRSELLDALVLGCSTGFTSRQLLPQALSLTASRLQLLLSYRQLLLYVL